MQKLILFYTSDLHGHVDQLLRIATIIAQTRDSHPTTPVLFIDGGDAQDKWHPLSKATQGEIMYRLLGMAGCQCSVLSNKCMTSYGLEILETWRTAADFPILVANLAMPDGSPIPYTLPSTILNTGLLKLGVIGLTAVNVKYVLKYSLNRLSLISVIEDEYAALIQQGADAVIVLSHMGIYADQRTAKQLPYDIDLILGGHSHVLTPKGTWENLKAILHVGAYGDYLGQVDLGWDGEILQVERMQTIPITDVIEPHPELQALLLDDRC